MDYFRSYHTVDGEIISSCVDNQTPVALMTDELGSVIRTEFQYGGANFRYTPYGKLMKSTLGYTDFQFGWVGSLGYRETNLTHAEQYVRARHYSSTEARWTTVDPLWPFQLPFTYVHANPVNLTDRMGLSTDPYPCPPPDPRPPVAPSQPCDCYHVGATAVTERREYGPATTRSCGSVSASFSVSGGVVVVTVGGSISVTASCNSITNCQTSVRTLWECKSDGSTYCCSPASWQVVSKATCKELVTITKWMVGNDSFIGGTSIVVYGNDPACGKSRTIAFGGALETWLCNEACKLFPTACDRKPCG